MVTNKKKTDEELGIEEVQSPSELMEIMVGFSDIIYKIEEAEDEDDKKKILEEIDMEPFIKVFNETLIKQIDEMEDVIPKQKKKLNDKIEVHKNLVKILNSIDIQNPKIEELIKKENELIILITKIQQNMNLFIDYFKSLQNIIPFMEQQDVLEEEIEKLTEELNKNGILLDKV